MDAIKNNVDNKKLFIPQASLGWKSTVQFLNDDNTEFNNKKLIVNWLTNY